METKSMNDITPDPAQVRVPSLRMAAGAGIAVASIYYNQPMLGLMAKDFPGSGIDGLIPTITQLGYALGLFFLVPLGDLFERRQLIATLFGALVLSLSLTAMAPTVTLLVAASALLGASATVAQQIVPFAAHLAPVQKRGAIVGTVMAGLLGGILLSRTIAGFIATLFGWRDMFLCAIPMVIIIAFLMLAALPNTRSGSNLTYPQLIKSLFHLWNEFAELRWATITQALLFAAFSAFWTILSLLLEQPQFNLGPAAAGMFGIVGLVGVLAAPIAGKIADTKGPRLVVIIGAIVTLISWTLFGVWQSIFGLVIGVVLLDFGVQSTLVSNQHIIYALRPEARARLNTIFMGGMFIGGALGSATATIAWRSGNWDAVAGLGILFAALAVGTQLSARHIRNTNEG